MDLQLLAPVTYEISSYMDNASLLLLLFTPLWEEVKLAARDERWWKIRTECLVSRKLTDHSGCWKRVYKSLLKNGVTFNATHDYGCTLLIRVLFELGADPTEDMGRMLDLAASDCTREGMQLILSDERVQPDIDDSACLLTAVEENNIEALRVILEDGRADPAEEGNAAIRGAVEEGYTEIVKLLLADERVDPSAYKCQALTLAVRYGFSDIYKLLIEDKRMRDRIAAKSMNDPCHDVYELEAAIIGGHEEIVSLILQHQSRIQPWALYIASKMGKESIVKLLLARHSPGAIEGALSTARARGHQAVVSLLLAAESPEAT